MKRFFLFLAVLMFVSTSAFAAQGGLSSAVPFASAAKALITTATGTNVATNQSDVVVTGKVNDIYMICSAVTVSYSTAPSAISATECQVGGAGILRTLDNSIFLRFAVAPRDANHSDGAVCGIFKVTTSGQIQIRTIITPTGGTNLSYTLGQYVWFIYKQ